MCASRCVARQRSAACCPAAGTTFLGPVLPVLMRYGIRRLARQQGSTRDAGGALADIKPGDVSRIGEVPRNPSMGTIPVSQLTLFGKPSRRAAVITLSHTLCTGRIRAYRLIRLVGAILTEQVAVDLRGGDDICRMLNSLAVDPGARPSRARPEYV